MSRIEKKALEAFDQAVQKSSEFKPRSGQRQMAAQVAKTLTHGTLGEAEYPQRAIAVIQAGTGVGKSLAACIPAIIAAQERNTRVIISTATVALQEQLMHKDLPQFSQLLDQPFNFALAKGRGRYVCKLKLERAAGGQADTNADLFEDVPEDPQTPNPSKAALSDNSVVLYQELVQNLASGAWDGDRDSLEFNESTLPWTPIAAERSTCTGKHCPQFNQCTYYDARKKVASATVIVANHDLLLASVGAKLLPDLNNALLIVDEGHELPSVASAQFSASADLSNLRWLDQMGSRLQKVGTEIKYRDTEAAVALTRQIKQAMSDLQGLVMSLYGSCVNSREKNARLPNGVLPEALVEPVRLLFSTSMALAGHMKGVSDSLNEKIKEEPHSALRLATMYASLGALAPTLDGLVQTVTLLLGDSEAGSEFEDEPDAKWFSFGDDGGYVRVMAHASPLIPGKLLVGQFWAQVRSAVVTSATLTSCGSFDFFLREVGLDADPDVTQLAVDSPFDFASQGRLVVVKTDCNPRDIAVFNQEMIAEFILDAAEVTAGALALFTSRSHLQQAYDSLPEALAARVLLQGTRSRNALLKEHKRRVDAGEPSIIMGLQTFGQGVDLPGNYCETVFVAKLPFTPPSDPIGEARAEWLATQRRDAFNELSVPAAGIKLNQWAGRLIRTESDQGTVVCYDKRLTDTAYGRRILSGMPKFALSTRNMGEIKSETSVTWGGGKPRSAKAR